MKPVSRSTDEAAGRDGIAGKVECAGENRISGAPGQGALNDKSVARETHAVQSNQLLSFLLALMGCAALAKARLDAALHQAKWLLIAETGFYIVVCVTLLVIRRRSPFIVEQHRPLRYSLIAGFLLLPVLSFFAYRAIQLGEATEFLLLIICQNVSLFAVTLARSRAGLQLSVLFSFFLIVFVTTISESSSILLLTLPYLICGIWWLAVIHWSRLEVHMPARVKSNFRVRSVSVGLIVLLIASMVVLVGWKHEPIMQAINGVMPTSGGKRFADRYARGGVGDGDFFVAAQNHGTTVGPVESDLFLESTKPSLFDIMEENYDRALIPIRKKSERAFSPDDVELKHAREKIIQSEQSGRTFRVLRGEDRPAKITESRSNALFYLSGPSPIRLALRYFDQFDGLDWSVSQEVKNLEHTKFVGVQVGDEYWVRFRSRERPVSRDKEGSRPPAHPYFQGLENHSVKVVRLATNRILTPSSVSGWHFDKCENSSYFGYADDGAIVFRDRQSIPELAVYHLVAKGVNYRSLSDSAEVSLVRTMSPFAKIPELESKDQIRELAKKVTRSARNDWEKVEAIVNFLRSEFELVEGSRDSGKSSADEGSPLTRFLKTRRGPDYLFATLAILMIRSLEMEARLVNGFYVGTEDYDAYSAQSIVHSRNLHFWAEVRVNGADWISIEPSPGYAPPRSKYTMMQRVSSWMTAIVRWTLRNPLLSLGSLFALLAIWIGRRLVFSFLLVVVWLVAGAGSVRRRMMATLKLMRRRMKIQAEEIDQWSVAELFERYAKATSIAGDESAAKQVNALSCAVNQLLYRSNPTLRSPDELRRTCWRLAWTPFSKTET